MKTYCMDPTYIHLPIYSTRTVENILLLQTVFDPVRGRMPPEGAKQKTDEAADINVEIIDTLSPFEKQMMDRIDELHGTLKDI